MPSRFIIPVVAGKNEITVSRRYLLPAIHCGIIRKSQDMETTWVSSNRWMDKENVMYIHTKKYSVQFSSVTQSCPTLCIPTNRSMPGLPVHHQLPEFTQTHIHQVGDAIQPSHPLLSPSPPASNPSQHQSLFRVNSSHEVAKVLEFQL